MKPAPQEQIEMFDGVTYTFTFKITNMRQVEIADITRPSNGLPMALAPYGVLNLMHGPRRVFDSLGDALTHIRGVKEDDWS